MGTTPEQICHAAGVTPAPALATDAFFRLWHWAEDQYSDRGIGLELGSAAIENGYGVAARVALHAPNFGRALKALSRYKQLTCPELVEIETRRDHVLVRFRWLQTAGPAPRLLVDMTMASLASLAQRGTGGKVRPARLDLARREEGQAYLYQHFSCPVSFEAETDTMVFHRAALDVPMLTAQEAPFVALIRDLEHRLAEGDGMAFTARLRNVIAQMLSEGRQPAIATAASLLNVSCRTLQRRLGDDDTSFQRELARVRHLIARRLLLDTDLDMVAIAILLGFQEPNSFTRHFHARERISPLCWRATQQQGRPNPKEATR